MSRNSDHSYSGGISTGGLLGVVFVTLKLLHVIDWSWWWVLAPFWMPLALILGIVALYFLVPMVWMGLSALIYAILAGGERLWRKIRGR